MRFSFACVPKHLHKTALMNWWNRHRKIWQRKNTSRHAISFTGLQCLRHARKLCQAVKCGVNASALYHRENYYKEAFELLRNAELLMRAGEQKLKKDFPDLRFRINKERLQMYISLKNPTRAKEQLNRLEETAKSCPKWLSKQWLSVYPSQLLLHFRHEFAGGYSFQETDRTV